MCIFVRFLFRVCEERGREGEEEEEENVDDNDSSGSVENNNNNNNNNNNSRESSNGLDINEIPNIHRDSSQTPTNRLQWFGHKGGLAYSKTV